MKDKKLIRKVVSSDEAAQALENGKKVFISSDRLNVCWNILAMTSYGKYKQATPVEKIKHCINSMRVVGGKPLKYQFIVEYMK